MATPRRSKPSLTAIHTIEMLNANRAARDVYDQAAVADEQHRKRQGGAAPPARGAIPCRLPI
jgi:hypothetical protein